MTLKLVLDGEEGERRFQRILYLQHLVIVAGNPFRRFVRIEEKRRGKIEQLRSKARVIKK